MVAHVSNNLFVPNIFNEVQKVDCPLVDLLR